MSSSAGTSAVRVIHSFSPSGAAASSEGQGRAVLGLYDAADQDVAEEQANHDEPWDQHGGEELAHRHVGHRGVDDDHQGGRDHGAERAAGADRAGDQDLVVAVAQHHRDRHHPDNDLDGADDAGGGGDDRGHGHGGQRQPAFELAEPELHGPEQALGDTRTLEHATHEDERRNRREQELHRRLGDAAVELQANLFAEKRHAHDERSAKKGERNRDAKKDEEKEQRKHQRCIHFPRHRWC
jgi:hypothetical protein